MSTLYRRIYLFGERDCFTFIHDYYNSIGVPFKGRDNFLDKWWEGEENYFCPEYMINWGFKPSESTSLEVNDLLVFSVKSKVPNHCGVYFGEEYFGHHAYGRLSCKESLDPLWRKFLTGVYKYEKDIS